MASSKETWYCETCDVDLAIRQDVIEHLKSAHGETSDNPSGVREMVSHLDGRDYYSGSFRWTFTNGAVLLQSYWHERAEDDPMRMG